MGFNSGFKVLTIDSGVLVAIRYRSLSKQMKIKICRTVILSVLYGCETWSVTLRGECWLGVFKYTGLKKIYLDPKYRKLK